MRRALQDYTARVLGAAIRAIPDGRYEFEDALDDDGFGTGPVTIRAVGDDRAAIARPSTSPDPTPQVEGSVNANYAMTLSACLYAFRCLVGDDVLYNAGVARPLTVIAPAGIDRQCADGRRRSPAATSRRRSASPTSCSARSARRLPDRMPAASQGTMNNVTLGGTDPRTGRRFAYYETMGGGMGGRKGLRGLSGVHTHMSNTRNTPVEAIEHYLPVRIRQYALRQGQRRRGRVARRRRPRARVRNADGHERHRFSRNARRGQPYGAQGGEPGASGSNTLIVTAAKKHCRARLRCGCAPAIGCESRRRAAGDTGQVTKLASSQVRSRTGRRRCLVSGARRIATAKRALIAASLGWMLDAFDVMLYALVLQGRAGSESAS